MFNNMSQDEISEWAIRLQLLLVDAASSVQWSLGHWYIKRVYGEEIAREIAYLAPNKSAYFRLKVWKDIRDLPGITKYRLIAKLLHKKTRRKFLRQEKKRLLPHVKEANSAGFIQDFKQKFLEETDRFFDLHYDDQQTIAESLYPELQCDFPTIFSESWRAGKAFPITILNSPREEHRLTTELSSNPDNYNELIVSYLWQLGNDPYSLQLPQPRKNDLLFETVQQNPSDCIGGDQVARALGELFVALSQERTARELFRHGMARIIRHEFALSRNRNTISSSDIEARQHLTREQKNDEDSEDLEPWDPEDTNSLRGYEEVDYRMEHEAIINTIRSIRNQLPTKQKEAFDIYLEHFQEDRAIESICLEKGLDPVTVRNNFQAIKRKDFKLNK